MSTKIFDAYMARATVDEVYRALALDFRPAIRAHVMRAVGAQMSESEDPWAMTQRIEEAMQSGTRDKLNHSFSAVIFLKPKFQVTWDKADDLLRGNWVLVQFFGVEREHEALVAAFVRRHKWLDFHYQNSCDRPKPLSKVTWDARRRIWDAVYEHTHVPNEAGLVVEMVNEYWASLIPFRMARTIRSSPAPMHPPVPIHPLV